MSVDQDLAESMCANHPQAAAIWVCTDCQARWCNACVKQVKLEAGRTVTICEACHGLCERVSRGAQGEMASTFSGGLLESLAYPFRGTALLLVLLGVVLEVILAGAGTLVSGRALGVLSGGMFLLWGVGIGVGAFVLTYLRQVLLTSSDGEPAPPPWPEFDSSTLGEAALQFLAIYLVSFGPWTVCTMWLHSDTAAIRWLCHGLLAAGACYFPMAVLAVVIYDSVSALNPLLIVVSIIRALPRYLGLCAWLGAIAGIGYGADLALTALNVPFVAAVLRGFGALYAAVLLMRTLGWFYFCSREQLAWS